MPHVDALSRNPIVCLTNPDDLNVQLQVTQARDPAIKSLLQSLPNHESPSYEMHNGIVYRKIRDGRLLFFVPREMEQQLISTIHEKIGHSALTNVMRKSEKITGFRISRKRSIRM